MRGRQLGTFVGCSKALLACSIVRWSMQMQPAAKNLGPAQPISVNAHRKPVDLHVVRTQARYTCGALGGNTHFQERHHPDW
ncbi:hypothetical protein PR003_g33508 [Phytophthora rubi]|uniref:Secreted protein n=1 Tax=Phytophthora rubi TaxID=129364 RepID=A0A6A3G8C0_9STRA|nr:hypothetical protein PR002_g32054 [Phytophthora rubi]KAE8954774.1 hypothetical protein PR001_g32357 [Phytophthora rubi]KAE9262529.1 hypothetical protein PR003_g33508 [Phytophthora rubi]